MKRKISVCVIPYAKENGIKIATETFVCPRSDHAETDIVKK